jgi:hypothetical protein
VLKNVPKTNSRDVSEVGKRLSLPLASSIGLSRGIGMQRLEDLNDLGCLIKVKAGK